uniref:G-protein coupled receptors family 1 profile domain-containing protein n=1 Tax=Anabas testudineus TaxID=64144 RepID=A0A3Q1IGJ8_ANATE
MTVSQYPLLSVFGRASYNVLQLFGSTQVMLIKKILQFIAGFTIDKSLHQPMYIFICCLSLNSLYGSAGFFPRFLMDILSDTHFISRPFCFLQMYIIHTYKGHELNILTVMSYDRLVAICQPLHYHRKMTFRTVIHLVIFVVLYPVSVFGYLFYLSISLTLCGNELRRFFCTNWSVVQLSCVDTMVISITSQLIAVTSIFTPLFFVLYTYLRILLVCSRSSSEFRGKALQTCLPHIVTFVNFCISIFIEVSLSQYKIDEVNAFIIAVLSLEFLIIPPITNPLIYSLNLPQIRAFILPNLKIRQEHGFYPLLFNLL